MEPQGADDLGGGEGEGWDGELPSRDRRPFGKKGSSPGSSAKLAPELQKGESFEQLEELERSDSIYPDQGPVSQAADL